MVTFAVTCIAAAAAVSAGAVAHGDDASAASVVSRVVGPVTGTVQPALRGSSWALPATAATRVVVTSLARGSSWS